MTFVAKCLCLLAAVARGHEGDAFSRALACYEARNYAESRRLFEHAAAERPGGPEIDFYLGRLALWFDDGAAALKHLERAARLAPREARIQNALGDAYGLAAQNAVLLAKLGWARKCREAYERAIELDPQNPAYRWSLLGYCAIAPRIAGGGMEKARVQAEAIASVDPMGGRIARATLALAEERFEAAFAEFAPVLRDTPDDFLALYHTGRCAALSGIQVERGIAALQRCLALRPPPGDGMPTRACVHFRLGNLLEKKGDLPAAQREYAEAQRLHPDFRAHKIALKN